jgi:hypothetical protein
MTADPETDEPQALSPTRRFVRFVAGPDRGPYADGNLARVLHPDERKPAMNGLDPLEVKWAVGGLLLSALFIVGIAVYIAINHTTTKAGHHRVAVAPDAYLIGGLVLLFCVVGLIALRARRRTVVAFSFFIIGLALTIPLLPLGLGMVILGGWLMLRAFRINKYGTANAKAVAAEAAKRPRGRDRNSSSRAGTSSKTKSGAKASADPSVRRPPTASKRYTPKAPPRKKVPKPTE